MNYLETMEYLFRQLPMYQRIGKQALKKDLGNTQKICQTLDNPQKRFKSIHIAGTNGKGSTAHALASVFQEAGYKTGLYTSPHLKDFRERIKINGKVIQKKEVIAFVEKYQAAFEPVKPSFFEWTVALAYYHFALQKVDIAIVETGLGGRLDSTNIIHPELSIITNIGLDHQEFLGHSKAKIAVEKAGIIKSGTPVIIGNHSGQRKIFEEIAQEQNAPILFLDKRKRTPPLETDLKGNYQKENLRTVFFACRLLAERGWKINTDQLNRGLKQVISNTGLRGRYEQMQSSPKVIADVAHNKEGIQIVLQQLQSESYHHLHCVLGFVKEKKLKPILSLFPKEATYYFSKANIPRAQEAENILNEAKKLGLKGSKYPSAKASLEAAKNAAQEEDLIFIGGSNFTVAELI